jgi:hypothetical protein
MALRSIQFAVIHSENHSEGIEQMRYRRDLKLAFSAHRSGAPGAMSNAASVSDSKIKAHAGVFGKQLGRTDSPRLRSAFGLL